MWLNWSAATINVMLQLFRGRERDVYIYIYIYDELCTCFNEFHQFPLKINK